MRTSQIKHNELALELPLIADLNLRVSRKAKYAQLKVLYDGRVELVVPQKYPRARLLQFVQENQTWLQNALDKYHQHKQADPHRFSQFPEFIDLAAIGEYWTVEYQMAESNRIRTQTQLFPHLLVSSQSPQQRIPLLKNWLSRKAKQALIPWFDDVSRTIGLNYNRVSIRGQKTRWGSCSNEKNISLNRCLLFLPAHLVEYVFIHELCHTQYLNHSKIYWQLVSRFDNGYRKHEKQLNQYSGKIPLWVV